uniref:Uncharacterized protein n=1 Tax=Globodera rostochiensis TaxID=31243 RepID=A0A914HGD8_GLORO
MLFISTLLSSAFLVVVVVGTFPSAHQTPFGTMAPPLPPRQSIQFPAAAANKRTRGRKIRIKQNEETFDKWTGGGGKNCTKVYDAALANVDAILERLELFFYSRQLVEENFHPTKKKVLEPNAQVALRFLIQQNVGVVPRSSDPPMKFL